MKVANTVDLKNKINKHLAEFIKGNPLIIIYRGKPAASIFPLTEDDMEDFIIEHKPSIRKKIKKPKMISKNEEWFLWMIIYLFPKTKIEKIHHRTHVFSFRGFESRPRNPTGKNDFCYG